jgi:gliding motility-associated-like protein
VLINTTAFTCANVGANTVVLTVTDVNGNSSTCNSTVTIIDTVKPIVTCSNIAQVATSGACNTVVTVNVPSSDACGIASVTNTFNGTNNASGSYPVGVTNVTYTVTDVNSNVSTCSFTVTITDTQNPVITCPLAGTTNVNADLGVCTYTQTGTVWNATGTDNCSTVTLSYTLSGATTGTGSTLQSIPFNLGNTTATWLVTDLSGNTATCSYVIKVNDTQNPVITCPANMIVGNTTDYCSGNPTFTLPVVSDNCSVASLVRTTGLASGATFPMGLTTETYVVTDGSGNTATCSFTITVIDNQIPTLICPTNITAFSTINNCDKIVNFSLPLFLDNCPGAGMVRTTGLASGSLFPVGVTTETYVVTDAAGNTATCSFTITVNDAQLPLIACPSNITVMSTPGLCGSVVNFSTPVGTDNCPSPVTTLTSGFVSGTLFPIGTTTETFTVTDASGNIRNCSFTITVTDLSVPTITCPSNISVNNSIGVCGAVVNFIAPVGNDNCSGSVTTQTSGLASGSTFPIGTTNQLFTVTDLAGNTASCSFTVAVTDTELPILTCPSNITQSNDIGLCSAVVDFTNISVTDNCPGSTFVQTAGIADAGTFPLGVTTETYLATDAHGNTSTCSFTVTVIDNQLPVIVCPSNITKGNDLGMCGAVVNYTTPVGTDNCSGANTIQTVGQATGTVFNFGTTTNTFQVTDGAGLVSTCTFTVTINDTEAPVINCPADTIISNVPGQCYTDLTYAAPVATDNCGIASVVLTSGLPSGSQFPLTTTTVTFQATDINGLTSQCSFNVTGVDSEGPVVVCPNNILKPVLPGTCGNTANFITPLPSDNCGVLSIVLTGLPSGSIFPAGINTQTYTVTDINGNVSTCTFTVNIVDNELPSIACNGADGHIETAYTNNLCTYVHSGIVWDAIGTDNCSVNYSFITTFNGIDDTITAATLNGHVFDLGTTQVKWFVTDPAGNAVYCWFNVDVLDTITPIITCPSPLPVSTNSACTFIQNTNVWDAIGTDNCPVNTTYNLTGATSGSGSTLQGLTFLPGLTTATWTAIDASGNSSTCSYTITVFDSVPPMITCNVLGMQTVNTDLANCTYENLNPLFNPTATDNCTLSSVVATLSGATVASTNDLLNTTFNKGITNVIWTATDAVGNSTTCTFDVTVIDNELPVITCNFVDTLDVFVDPTLCNITNTNPLLDPTITDNCHADGTYILSGATTGTGSTLMNIVFNHGVTRVDWTATDSSGNTSNCFFYVNVIDNEAPATLAVLAPVSFECTVIPPTAIDNCDNIITGTTTTVFNQGVYNVTWTFVDLSGNVSTATQVVTVDDITAPVPPVLADVLAECSATVTVIPTAIDNCVGIVNGTTSDPLTYTTQGTYVITWSFDDGNGNISTTTQNVIINDITSPVISAPIAVNVLPNNAGCTAINVSLGTPIYSDNCTVDTVYNDAPTVYNQGTTIVTWTVVDENGNASTSTQQVVVMPVTSTITPAPVCDIYTAPDNTVYTVSGIYTAIIPSYYGCDSIITINLTVNHSTASTDVVRACETYTSPSGLYTWTNSGTYMDTIPNAVGCDSIITTILTIDRMPTTNMVTLTNNSLFTALADTVEYQWVKCDNGFIWENGNEQTFTPLTSGEYAVILTNHTCVDTSDCMPIGLDLIVPQVISPNGDGVNDKFEVNGIYDYPNNVLMIYNRWGNLIYQTHGYNNDWDGKNLETVGIGGNDLPVGTYFYVLDLGKEGNTPEQNLLKGYIYLTR